MEQEKILKLLREIEDIKHEQNHIKTLFDTNNLSQLDDYLENELTSKYMIEKFVHNLINPVMPSNTQENADNACNFLERLKREKEAELMKEKLEDSEK